MTWMQLPWTVIRACLAHFDIWNFIASCCCHTPWWQWQCFCKFRECLSSRTPIRNTFSFWAEPSQLMTRHYSMWENMWAVWFNDLKDVLALANNHSVTSTLKIRWYAVEPAYSSTVVTLQPYLPHTPAFLHFPSAPARIPSVFPRSSGYKVTLQCSSPLRPWVCRTRLRP